MAWRKIMNLTSQSYNSLLKKLIIDGNKHPAPSMLAVYLKEFGMTGIKTVNIVSLYLCKHDISKALNFIKERGLEKASCIVSTIIVDSLVKKGRVHDADDFIKESGKKGSTLDVFAYSIVVDGLCKEGHLEKALDLCAIMKERGIFPNVITYNAIINALCRQGCLTEAFRLFNSMELINVYPTITTYGTLLSCLCAEGFLEDAIHLFEKMLHDGITPNAHIYNSLIYGHCRFGQMEKGLQLLHELESICLQPDCFTVSAIINGFCTTGDMEGALGFYSRYQKDTPPDFFGFFSLIKGLYSKGRMEEARSILRDMLHCQPALHFINQIGDNIDVESLTSILGVFCEEGNIKGVMSILSEIGSISFPSMRSNGINSHNNARRKDIKSWPNYMGSLPSTVPPPPWRPQEHDSDSICTLATSHDMNYMNIGSEMMKNEEVLRYNEIPRPVPHDFYTYYSIISSLCSKGELQKARNVVKTMLLNLKVC